MEEWLDDNKHLLGTIGMVILVVQVGDSVANGSFLLQFVLLLCHFFFLSFCVCFGAFVCVCLSSNKLEKRKGKKRVHPVAPMTPSSTEKVMKPVLSGRSGNPHNLKY